MSSHIFGIGTAAERYMKTADRFDSIAVTSMSVDDGFISNMKLSFLAGTDFSQNRSENSRFIIVNEEFVKALHLKEPSAAINRLITLTDSRIAHCGCAEELSLFRAERSHSAFLL
jgi:putative ABC transport system permease protein